MSPIDRRQCHPSSWVPPDEALPDGPGALSGGARRISIGYAAPGVAGFHGGSMVLPAGEPPMSIEIIPTGAALGAEIRGVDLARSIDDQTFAAIERAYYDHAVIFFRDQHITPPTAPPYYALPLLSSRDHHTPPPQRVPFARRFGEIEFNIFGERWSVPGCPEIVVVSNITDDGKPIGIRRGGENWDSDMGYAARPPRGTMLYAHEIPTLHGLPLGDTEFASAAAAWDALPATLQGFLDGKRAVFDFRGRQAALRPPQ